MRRFRHVTIYAALLASAAVVACVTVRSELLVPPTKYAPIPVDSVRVFMSEQELKDRGYAWESVAILFASGSADYTSTEGMLRKVRQEAAKRGANGIFLSPQREPGLGERLFLGAGAQRKSQVAAIRWWTKGAKPETSPT